MVKAVKCIFELVPSLKTLEAKGKREIKVLLKNRKSPRDVLSQGERSGYVCRQERAHGVRA